MVKNKKLKMAIIKSSNIIKKKYQMLKSGRIDDDLELEKNFKPIIEPLKMLVNNQQQQQHSKNLYIKKEIKTEDNLKSEKMEEEEELEEELEEEEEKNDFNDSNESYKTITSDISENSFSFNPIDYIKKAKRFNSDIDTTYGVRSVSKNLMVGNSPIEFDNEDFIIIKKIKYSNTHGLYELLFMKKPNKHIYTSDDLELYKEIGVNTNLFKRHYMPDAYINGNGSYKYTHIISKLIESEKKKNIHKTGSGGGGGCDGSKRSLIKKLKNYGDDLLMNVEMKKPSLVYWNNANELVDRLKLLIASQNVGNNSHNNEITSIIEELKEENIIF